MAYSTQRAVSDGTMAYLDISIKYQKRDDIKVFYDNAVADPATWSWQGVTDKRILFHPNVPTGVEVVVKRTTRLDHIINVFASGAKFNNTTMDQNFEQMVFLSQEAVEGAQLAEVFNDVNFHGFSPINIADATQDNQAVSLGQVKTMNQSSYQAMLDAQAARDLAQKWASQLTTTVDGTSYSAKQYALNASTSQTAAAASAAAALASQGAASTSAAAALSSQTAAASSATASETSRLASEAARDMAQEVAADVLQIQENAQDAIDIANTFDGRLTAAETDASNAVDTANEALAATGGNFTNDVVIAKGTPTLTLSDPGNTASQRLKYVGGGVLRWDMGNESSNSNLFTFKRYNAAGAFIDTPWQADYSTGLITVTGAPTAQLGIATKQYVDDEVVGQCKFVITSSTSAVLIPWNGNKITINGVRQKIPSGGVSLSSTGTVANTRYYVYAFMNAGVMTLERSTTTYSVDMNNGCVVKTGDPSRTLVGCHLCLVANLYSDGGAVIGGLSWFNRIVKNASATGATSNFGFASGTGGYIEYDGGLRCIALNWGDCVVTHTFQSGVTTGVVSDFQVVGGFAPRGANLTVTGGAGSNTAEAGRNRTAGGIFVGRVFNETINDWGTLGYTGPNSVTIIAGLGQSNVATMG